MRAVVTCECCGHRQTVARPIAKPEAFHVVCHGCEGVLRVEVTAQDLRAAPSSPGRRPGAPGRLSPANPFNKE